MAQLNVIPAHIWHTYLKYSMMTSARNRDTNDNPYPILYISLIFPKCS